jgi:hypothetical protein
MMVGGIAELLFLLFSTAIGCLILWKLFDVVRNSVNKNKTNFDDQSFDRLAKAFIKYRKETGKRLQNIEAIITEEKFDLSSLSGSRLKETQSISAVEKSNSVDRNQPPIEIKAEEKEQKQKQSSYRNSLRIDEESKR